MSSLQLFVIGSNPWCELGFNQPDTVHILTPCPEKKISKAFPGLWYCIYADDNYDNLWCAGAPFKGSRGVTEEQGWSTKELLPITYFDKHGIKIKQISVNPSSYGTFFISKDNKLYACGNNEHGQLGIASQKCI